jgi:hypothetical protein
MYVFCSMFFLSFLPSFRPSAHFLFVISLSLSLFPSVAPCLHSLTPHDTNLTIIPFLNRSTHITCYPTGTVRE